jgi:HTH-type transcriptional regulator/antitoxin HigA
MTTNENIQSDFAVPPGEYLLEVVQERDMSQADLSRRMGRPAQAINEIIKGEKAITPETALQLEQVLGVPAHIWTGLEAEFQLTKARRQELDRIAAEGPIAEDCPYAEMVKFGWVPRVRGTGEKVRELRKFFGVASLRNIQDVSAYQPAFRKTKRDCSAIALAAWLRRGELKAHETATEEFSATHVRESLGLLRRLTLEDPSGGVARAGECLAGCGIALVILPRLPRTNVNGAAFWSRPGVKAVAVMILRGRWPDVFWFSLLHEIGHILLHDKREVFLENGEPRSETQEREADRFAADVLIPPHRYEVFAAQGNFTVGAIRNFADSVQIGAGIVVGRLQHERLVAANALNGLRPGWNLRSAS